MYLRALPGLVPVLIATTLVTVLLAPRAAARWRLHPVLATAWTLSAVVPGAGLLTPTRFTPSAGLWAPEQLAHGFVGHPAWVGSAELLTLSERSLNVWLFVPLGVLTVLVLACGAPPRLAVWAAAVPVLGEVVQEIVPALDRVGLQWPDLSANWQGLLIGGLAGLPLAAVALATSPVPVPRRVITDAGPTR